MRLKVQCVAFIYIIRVAVVKRIDVSWNITDNRKKTRWEKAYKMFGHRIEINVPETTSRLTDVHFTCNAKMMMNKVRQKKNKSNEKEPNRQLTKKKEGKKERLICHSMSSYTYLKEHPHFFNVLFLLNSNGQNWALDRTQFNQI